MYTEESNPRRRVGLIVPSSNVTMEIEIPALLHARAQQHPTRFSVHASRMRMKSVTTQELRKMDQQSVRYAIELSDAAVDVQAYACLVALMSQGAGYHRVAARALSEAAAENGHPVTTVTSAGALVDGLQHLGARRVAMICPYRRPLARKVVDGLEAEGIAVQDCLALEIEDNLTVAAQDPMAPARLWRKLDTRGVDAIIASACVQMPSLPAIAAIEAEAGIPTLSAAVATTWAILRALQLDTVAPGGGALLTPPRNRTR